MRVLLLVIYTAVLFSAAVECYEHSGAFDSALALPGSGLSFASVHYPGWEVFQPGFSLSLGWYSPWGMEELEETSMFGGISGQKLGFYAVAGQSGFELWREEQQKMGIAYRFTDRIGAGLRLSRNGLRIMDFGDDICWSADVGAVLKVLQNNFISFSAENVTRAGLRSFREKLDRNLRASASLKVSDDAVFLISGNKTDNYRLSYDSGFIFNIGKVLAFGIMGGNGPSRYELYASVETHGLVIAWRGRHHHELGLTNGLVLSVNFEKDSTREF